jgi:poly(hydroxyalkanoate) granule-associated protein
MAEEEIEITVRHIDDEEQENKGETTSMVDILRRLLLASIGAIAMTRDEAERIVQRLVERGELAQKDGEKILEQGQEHFHEHSQHFSKTVSSIGEHIESSLEQMFTRLNIPSRGDIDDLSSKIAHLTSRIEELHRNKT